MHIGERVIIAQQDRIETEEAVATNVHNCTTQWDKFAMQRID